MLPSRLDHIMSVGLLEAGLCSEFLWVCLQGLLDGAAGAKKVAAVLAVPKLQQQVDDLVQVAAEEERKAAAAAVSRKWRRALPCRALLRSIFV
jgi:hypothetical protein